VACGVGCAAVAAQRLPLIERDVAVPAVFELPLEHRVAKDDRDQVVTKLTTAAPPTASSSTTR
jgi:hypothetical protein